MKRCRCTVPINVNHERIQFLTGGFAALPTTHGNIVIHGVVGSTL